MTTEVDIPLAAELDASLDDLSRPQPHRPVPEDHRLGRWLRVIAGIREDVLDWVPEERPRYSRLGAIILNTGWVAALSLLTALNKFFDTYWVFLLPVALFWGWVVVSIDGWLVASTHGNLSAARYRMFVPRLLLAVLLGFVIAEPLLLLVFHPAIDREVRDSRSQEIVSYASLLRACNPVPAAPVDPARCKDYRLTVKDSPAGVQQQLDKAILSQKQQQGAVDQINQKLRGMEDLARAECNGQPGRGFSGIVGEGPNCNEDRREADQFRKDSKLEDRQAQLVSLGQQVDQLTAQLGDATQTYGQEINSQITAAVDERRSHQTEIGILEEDAALGRLSSRSAFVFAGQWLVRFLLVAIDCLPILTKLMGGTTTYDRLLSRQLADDDYLHGVDGGLRKRRDTSDKEVEFQQLDYDVRTRIELIAEADRVNHAQREAELDARIDELAARLRRQADDA